MPDPKTRPTNKRAKPKDIPALDEPQARPEPWEKQKGESAQAFEAFTIYRDQGVARSQRRVASHLSKSGALIAEWSSKWRWVERAEAWDAYLDAERRRTILEKQEKALDRHDQIAGAILTLVAQRLAGQGNVTQLDPGKMNAQDVARLVDIGVKVQRLALAIPDPKTQIEIDAQITVDEADRLADTFEAYLAGVADGADRQPAEG